MCAPEAWGLLLFVALFFRGLGVGLGWVGLCWVRFGWFGLICLCYPNLNIVIARLFFCYPGAIPYPELWVWLVKLCDRL